MSIYEKVLEEIKKGSESGKELSVEEIANKAESIHQQEFHRILLLLADIRSAAGDSEGRLMQADLIEHIAKLAKKAEMYDNLLEN